MAKRFTGYIMDNARKYLELVCEICGEKYSQQERVFKKAKWPYRCPNHRHNIYKCVDCEKEIHRGSIRCKKCYGKTMTLPQNYCVDCGIEIAHHRKRCLACHNINQDQGKSRERTKFNASPQWNNIRTMCFERDNYSCVVCGDLNYRGRGGTLRLEAHHINSWKDHPGQRLDVNNIITLCASCHKDVHTLIAKL